MSNTITESYNLPSNGKIYKKPVKAEVTLRSMNTEDEMKRLSPSDTPYKVMSELIEGCMLEKPSISVYDMCIGDYQYLLHKLRIVTYGPEYKIGVRCPICGKIDTKKYNLDELELHEYDKSIDDLIEVVLPTSGKKLTLNFQTPRILDYISKRKKEILKKSPEAFDPTYLLTLQSLIDTVDGEKLTETKLESLVRKLPMRDANMLIQISEKLNNKVGLDTNITVSCSQCGNNFDTTFRFTSEFFGPTIDE